MAEKSSTPPPTDADPTPDDFSFEKVWALVRTVPRGRVTTYGDIARALGTGRLLV